MCISGDLSLLRHTLSILDVASHVDACENAWATLQQSHTNVKLLWGVLNVVLRRFCSLPFMSDIPLTGLELEQRPSAEPGLAIAALVMRLYNKRK